LVSSFADKRPLYEEFVGRIKDLMGTLVDGAGIRVDSIHGRTKTVKSLSDKLNRPAKAYTRLEGVPDLAGLRVITYLREDADQVVELIRKEFDVDDEESEDVAARLAPNEFGYLSVHLVIRLSEGRRRLSEWSKLQALRAEVQVRTVLQHAWASISHALQYKQEDEIPWALRRRLARLSALLEVADEEFAELNREHNDLKASSDRTFTEVLMVLRQALGRRRHSYEWIREKTHLTLTDEEFDKLVQSHPETFHSVRIVRHDESGERIVPGRPGLQLKDTPSRTS
jgi:ppGpp synthetase/RelA/SpoT-type nucleotidyltranferase